MCSPCNSDDCASMVISRTNSQYKNRILIEEKMATLLIDSFTNPQKRDENGVFFLKGCIFAANTMKLSLKLGITVNALNKDFRHHKIKCMQKLPANLSFNLSDMRGWKIFQHSNIDFTLQNILNNDNKFVSKWIRNGKKNKNVCKRKSTIKPVKETIPLDSMMMFENEDMPYDYNAINSDSDIFSDFPDVFSCDDSYFLLNL